MFGFGKKKKAKEEAKRLAEQKAAEEKAAKEREEDTKEKEEKEKAENAKKADAKKAAKPEEGKKPEKTEPKKEPQKKEEDETEVDVEVSNKTRKAVYRVLYDKEDKLWKIKKDGAKRVIDSRRTKEEALARVQELAESQDSNFVVYKKDGKFQKKANLNLSKPDKGDN